MQKLFLSLFVITALSITGCKKAENGTSCSNGSFTCTINGTAFTGKTFNNTLIKANSGGTIGKRLDIRATAADGKVVIITVTNLQGAATGKCMVEKVYYIDAMQNYTDGYNYEGALGTYMTSSTVVAGMTLPTPGTPGNITITSCNSTDFKISGTFTFTADQYGSPPSYDITGSFTDMCYTYSE